MDCTFWLYIPFNSTKVFSYESLLLKATNEYRSTIFCISHRLVQLIELHQRRQISPILLKLLIAE